jgi:lipid-A-disaccharide synthase
MARNLDALAVIFPFEVDCYADTGLSVEFVGHPFMAPDYSPPVRYDPSGPILLLPGSRPKAVGLIAPVIIGGYREFARKVPGRGAVIIHPAGPIRAQLEAAGIPPDVRLQQRGERVAASAVLTSSGTMSMHCALAGIPGAIAYRTDPLTYLIARWIVRVRFLGIANLLLEEPMYPEYIQGAATSAALAMELDSCLTDPLRRERTFSQSRRLAAMLARPTGDNEADWLLRKLN